MSTSPLPPPLHGIPLRDRTVLGEAGRWLREGRARHGPRHAWIRGPAGAEGPHPGVIVARRRVPDGEWLFQVVYVVVGDDGGDPTTVQQWVPADLVRPAASDPPVGWVERPAGGR